MSHLSRSRLAVTWLFFALGFGGGNLLLRIITIREQLGLSHRLLGLVLLAGAAGAVTAFLASDRLLQRVSISAAALGATFLYYFSVPLVGFAPNALLLAASFFAMGATSGLMNVLMNAMAITLERALERPILGQLHATCSLGGLLGASCGSALASLGVTMLPHLLATTSLLTLVTVMTIPGIRALGDAQAEDPGHASPEVGDLGTMPSGLAILGLMVGCAAICEGAMADWTGVYLRERMGVSLASAGRGYMAFAVAMVVTRYFTDAATARLGARRLVMMSGTIAALGIVIELSTGNLVLTLFGIGCVGIGLACTVPTVYREATRRGGAKTSAALALMANCSYTGFLIGPPLIGFLADVSSLRASLTILILLSGVIGFGGRRLGARPTRAASLPTPAKLTMP